MQYYIIKSQKSNRARKSRNNYIISLIVFCLKSFSTQSIEEEGRQNENVAADTNRLATTRTRPHFGCSKISKIIIIYFHKPKKTQEYKIILLLCFVWYSVGAHFYSDFRLNDDDDDVCVHVFRKLFRQHAHCTHTHI